MLERANPASWDDAYGPFPNQLSPKAWSSMTGWRSRICWS